MFCEPFETGHLLYVCQQVGGMKWPKWSFGDLCPLSWVKHVLLLWSLNRAAFLGAFCRERSLTFQVLTSRETDDILMLVSMINTLKISRTCHVFTDPQKVAKLLLTELAWGTSELSKWYLHSAFVLMAVSFVGHGLAFFTCAVITQWWDESWDLSWEELVCEEIYQDQGSST